RDRQAARSRQRLGVPLEGPLVLGAGAALARPLLPLPLLLAAQARVRADRDRAQLALELQPAGVSLPRQLARPQSRLHGAVRLRVVRAVVEAAGERELLDVRERLLDGSGAAVPELELAEPGSVDDDPAAGQEDELAVRRRVASFVVVHARFLDCHQLAAREAVDERRLADAARAEQDRGRARLQPRAPL